MKLKGKGATLKRRTTQSGHPTARDAVAHESSFDRGPAAALLARHSLLKYPFACTFGNAQLVIEEGVFCPTLTKAAPLLLSAVDFQNCKAALDVFAGSGAFGINAALAGATVVTVDTSPQAVACTIKNSLLNGVTDSMDPRIGSMATSLDPLDTFDLIVANPPLLPGEPSDPLSAAIYDPGLAATCDFVARVPKHLRPNGNCYFISSDVLERELGTSIKQLCNAAGLTCMTAATSDLGYERYNVHKITHD
jgi:methylase of polypeptide subunit release factors